MSSDCVFCKIVAGDLPSTRVYEDQNCLAFMDIGPVMKGHVLVIPKQHYDPITAIPPDLLQKVITVVQKVARALYAGLNAESMNITQANGDLAGQIIPHIHFHLIPRSSDAPDPHNWFPGKYESKEEMESLATRIRNAMEK